MVIHGCESHTVKCFHWSQMSSQSASTNDMPLCLLVLLTSNSKLVKGSKQLIMGVILIFLGSPN